MVCFRRPFREDIMLSFFPTRAARRYEVAGTALMLGNPRRLPARFRNADTLMRGIPGKQAAAQDPGSAYSEPDATVQLQIF